jgi:hypothetical protein
MISFWLKYPFLPGPQPRGTAPGDLALDLSWAFLFYSTRLYTQVCHFMSKMRQQQMTGICNGIFMT